MTFVVDTNVLVVANGKSPQADTQCELDCIAALRRVKSSSGLALDHLGYILAQYASYCSHKGAPGVGDEFFKWAFNTQYSTAERNVVTPHPDRGFAEFPVDPRLAKFDQDDRVFVAVALVSPSKAQVLNAVDSDYRDHSVALASAGVQVLELCAHCLRAP